ncbi:MAG: MBL fold metallo-hydrolase [Clostridia bacterium]|nr:MBL fold metallo-hydrolase [Clostridia bacterium]
MKLTFLGADHEVTGSMTLIEIGEHKILVDCGMEQGADIYENAELPVSPGDVEAMFLTHAHIDHSGKIPVLVANGFGGNIHATGATTKLCHIMLMDSAHIQESEAEWKSRKAQRAGRDAVAPMYTTDDAARALKQFKPHGYNEPFTLFDGVTVRFLDAGHLLGSSSIEFTVNEDGKETVLLFSGDVGNVSRPLIRDPQKPEKADIVVIESTYGDRLHGERPDYLAQLTAILQETLDRGGNLVIPCFAVGRTQEMLYLLREIKVRGLLKGHDRFPVYVDSPLAVEATNIYSADDMEPYYDDETMALKILGINPIRMDDLYLSITSDDSKRINEDRTPKVILSASGMCEAGRIRHHLKHNLWRKESTVMFVGYQTEGTLGRQLIDGATEIKLFGEKINVEAHIAQMSGISGHADRDMLLGWLKNITPAPKQVFVNHGEDTVCDLFASTVTETLGIPAEAPYSGACYEVSADGVTRLEDGNRVKLEKKAPAAQSDGAVRANSVLERLRAAGRRLCAIIERNKEGANKDLAKFADQINDLCNKWDR